MKIYEDNKVRKSGHRKVRLFNDKRKFDEESLKLYDLVKEETENLWIKLAALKNLNKMWKIFKQK